MSRIILPIAPTITTLTSGTGATYTPPPLVKFLRIRAVGGGGGGSGGGPSGGGGSPGTQTLFGSAANPNFIVLNPGGASGQGGSNVTGGSVIISAPAFGLAMVGGSGGQSVVGNGGSEGGWGCGTPFSGNVPGGWAGTGGSTAPANSGCGGGGGGGGSGSNICNGAGGTAGGYCDVYVYNIASSYTYTIGNGGSGAAGGSGGGSGAAGGSGFILIEEHYTTLP